MQKFPTGKFHAALQSDGAITRLLVRCTDRETLIARNARCCGRQGSELRALFGCAADAVGDCQHQHRDRKCKQIPITQPSFTLSELRSMSVNHSSTLTAAIATMEPSNFCLSPENPILTRPGGQVGCLESSMGDTKFS